MLIPQGKLFAIGGAEDKGVDLEKGEIVELGTHNELVAKRGEYFNLVINYIERK